LIELDTREPKFHRVLKALRVPYKRKTLPAGDIKIGPIVIERKEISDFVLSMQEEERLWKQCTRLAREKFPCVAITGDVIELSGQYQKRHMYLNIKAIRHAIASIYIRYAIPVIWLPNDVELVNVLIAMESKYSEGKLGITHLIRHTVKGRPRQITALCVLFGLSEAQATSLFRYAGGSIKTIFEWIDNKPYKIQDIHGIGESTVRRMQTVWKGMQRKVKV